MKKHNTWRYIFAIAVIALGVLLEYLKVGENFLGFNSVGIWLIFVGFVMIAVTTLQKISNKKRIVDERMIAIAHKAARVTFVAIILAAFVVMIIDGIKPMNIPYSIFMSYFVCFILLVYFFAYKILERYN